MSVQHTSWNRREISHTRQRPGSSWNWQMWRSDRKKSLSKGVWVRACTIQFMKHVLPKLTNPRRPWSSGTRIGTVSIKLIFELHSCTYLWWRSLLSFYDGDVFSKAQPLPQKVPTSDKSDQGLMKEMLWSDAFEQLFPIPDHKHSPHTESSKLLHKLDRQL